MRHAPSHLRRLLPPGLVAPPKVHFLLTEWHINGIAEHVRLVQRPQAAALAPHRGGQSRQPCVCRFQPGRQRSVSRSRCCRNYIYHGLRQLPHDSRFGGKECLWCIDWLRTDAYTNGAWRHISTRGSLTWHKLRPAEVWPLKRLGYRRLWYFPHLPAEVNGFTLRPREVWLRQVTANDAGYRTHGSRSPACLWSTSQPELEATTDGRSGCFTPQDVIYTRKILGRQWRTPAGKIRYSHQVQRVEHQALDHLLPRVILRPLALRSGYGLRQVASTLQLSPYLCHRFSTNLLWGIPLRLEQSSKNRQVSRQNLIGR